MTIIDKRLEFAAPQTLTATGALTNDIDLGSDRDIGVGKPLYFCAHVTAIDAASADETYVLNLTTDDNSSFSSPTTLASITIPRGTAMPAKFFIGMPNNNERYLRATLTAGGTTPSITFASVHLSLEHPGQWAAYPAAV